MILPNLNGLGNQNPLDQFRTIVTQKGGFQSPSRYLINITPPQNSGIRSITAYPESIIFPEQTINIISDRLFTIPRALPTSGDIGDMMLTFIIYNDWAERDYFERWMDYISNHPIKADKSPGVRSYYGSVGSMSVGFLNTQSMIKRKYKFTEVFPNALSPISFDSSVFGVVSFQVILSCRSDRFGYNDNP